ncbi:hypothetical protein C7377_1017 [Balneicella halophila]|uniref:Uncharacterized protein n=1 Tax=Balneicella halophila TaxID=1537566 RepID=A0A7L4UNU9_BALHA|nr:hypothetical protein [Balneicella halophila]PVX50704.1 hypothetical protein C7377_1017 [Balneicella halophila]
MKNKWIKLIVCVLLDAFGYLSYAVLGIGETIDIVWAPVAGWLNYQMFKEEAGAAAGLFTFVEEALPGTDFIPSFTITWLYAHVFSKNKKIKKTTSFLENFTKRSE